MFIHNVSKFAEKFAVSSGIGELMDDLVSALEGDGDMVMLGGGNPAHIPEVEACFRRQWLAMAEETGGIDFAKALGNYDAPGGNTTFIETLCELFHTQFDWAVTPEHVVLTNGSQAAFFALMNIFGGTDRAGIKKKILFPVTPEYIGYCDMGIERGMQTALRPRIESLEGPFYKYHIDFDALSLDETIGAVCVSRPTNPTGNVLTDMEIKRLADLTAAQGIPLLVDNAYGAPFPHILYTDVQPIWEPHMVLCMSLSKLGLPSVRTGIVVGPAEIIRMVGRLNAVMSLSPGGIGPAMVTNLVRNGELLRLSHDVIKPFYQAKVDTALKLVADCFHGLSYAVHKPEGAFFLWFWFKALRVSTYELYQRLKRKGVLVVPGHYFFPGLDEPWEHKEQCIRVNIAQPLAVLQQGLQRIASEVRLLQVL